MNQSQSLLNQAIQSNIHNLRSMAWLDMTDAELRLAFGTDAISACAALGDFARFLVQHSIAIEELSDRILVACRNTTTEGA